MGRLSYWAVGLGVVLLASGPASAALVAAPADPARQCDAAITAAAFAHAVPAPLLLAIGRVESGRRDPVTGSFAPWPWTIDVEGEGHLYASEAEAIEAVRRFQQAGRVSIDVGCMQVNLVQHPNAFASLEAAFDPRSNAERAADFLAQLHDATGDWMRAAGQYHSATEALAGPYRARLAATMQGGNPDGLLAMLAMERPGRAGMALAMGPPPAGAPEAVLSSMVIRRPNRAPPMALDGTGAGRSLDFYRSMTVRRASPLRPG